MGKLNTEARSTLTNTLGFLLNAAFFITTTVVIVIRNDPDSLLGKIAGIGAGVFLALLFTVLTICGFIAFAEQRRKS